MNDETQGFDSPHLHAVHHHLPSMIVRQAGKQYRLGRVMKSDALTPKATDVRGRVLTTCVSSRRFVKPSHAGMGK